MEEREEGQRRGQEAEGGQATLSTFTVFYIFHSHYNSLGRILRLADKGIRDSETFSILSKLTESKERPDLELEHTSFQQLQFCASASRM